MPKLLALVVGSGMLGFVLVACAGPPKDESDANDRGDYSAPTAQGWEEGLAAYNRGDYAGAVKLWQPLAAGGDARAQTSLGSMYQYGKGVAQDYGEAHGEGVTQDYGEAVKWFRLAADQGFAAAQNDLGAMYQDGQGVVQDYSEAMKLYRLAAAQGFALAQYNLGWMYQNGVGVAQDYVVAVMWYNFAALSLNSEAGKKATVNRDGLTAKMTTVEIKLAQEITQKCQQLHYQQCDDLKKSQIATNATPSTLIPSSVQAVPMQKQGGTYVVPVIINNALTLDFVVDSGADDVSIPADVVLTLIRTGTLSTNDFLGSQTYRLADGSTVPSSTFRIGSLKVGGSFVENVTASVAPAQGDLLLGQSFLGRFKSWSIDNARHALVLE